MIAPILPPEDALPLRKEALAWFVRRQGSDWSSEQESAFQEWLARDPRHGAMYARCDGQWGQFDGMPDDLMARMRAGLARDKAVMDALPAQPVAAPVPAKPSVPARRRFLQPIFATAGVAALAMGSAGFLAWQQDQPLFTQVFSTERGRQERVALPDGTLAQLDTATRLEVTYYRQRREARLIGGQAVFSVQPDTGRPFHVLAGPLRVTVVGTRFSVRYTPDMPDSNGVQVAVEEGRVRVARVDAASNDGEAMGSAFLLTAGQRIVSDSRGLPGRIAAVSADGIAPWRQQRVSFVDVPLRHALAELERYGRTGLVVRDPAVAALRLTGTFDPMNQATLRRALPRVLPVRLSETERGTEVLLVK